MHRGLFHNLGRARWLASRIFTVVSLLIAQLVSPALAALAPQQQQSAPQELAARAAALVHVTGVVMSPTRVPVPGATVDMMHSETGQHWVTWTDEKGKFDLPEAPVGHYKYQVEQLGFDSITAEADVSGNSKPVELTLKISSGPAAPAKKPVGPQQAKTAPAPSPNRRPQPQQQAGARPNGYGGGRGGFSRVNANAANNDLSADADAAAAGAASENGVLGEQASSDAFSMPGTIARGTTSGGDMNAFQMPGMGGFGGPGAQSGANPFGNPSGTQGQDANALSAGLGGPGGGVGPGGPGGGPGGPGGGGGAGGGRGGARGGRGGQAAGRGRRGPIGPNGPATAERLWGAQRLSRMAASRIRWSFIEKYANSAADARQYSLTGVQTPQIAGYNYSGGISAGGPLIIPKLLKANDKTTFFVNYQWALNRNPVNSFSTVPTLAERAGDFSALSTPIYEPGFLTGGTLASARTPFANNMIPSALFNPASAGLLAYIPTPNLAGTVDNFLLQGRTPSNSNRVNGRLIQTLTDKVSLSAVYNYAESGSHGYNNFPDLTSATSTLGQNAGLTFNQTWTKTFINATTVSWNRSSTGTLSGNSYVNNIAGDLGIEGISTAPLNYGIPAISFTNFTGLNDTVPSITHNQQWRSTDQVTWIHKTHNFRFGGEFRKNQNNRETTAQARGSFIFTGALTSELSAAGTPVSSTGVDFADFLLGDPYETTERLGSATYSRYWGLIGYAQDDWRVAKRFSVLLGIRYELLPPWTEKNDELANLVLLPNFSGVEAVTPTGATINGVQTLPASSVGLPVSLVKPDYKQISPRIGLAWKPPKTKTTVVRAGYSIFYNGSAYGIISNSLVNQPPFAESQTRVTQDGALLTLQQGFPATPLQSVLNTIAVDPNYRVGYAQIWNGSVETSLVRNLILNVAYTGTKGTRLDVLSSPNVYVGTGVDAARRISTASAFTLDQSDGDSIYHALQVRLQRRMSRGFQIYGTYTFSKSIDDASSIGGAGQSVVQNYQDFSAERALSPFDVRHQMTINYVYQFPMGERKPFFNHGKIADVMGNWQISGSTSFQTGSPFTPRLAGTASSNGGTGNNLSSRPNILGDPNLPASERSPLAFIDTSVFSVPAAGTFGDAGRDILTGPGSFNTNLALMKGMRFGRDQRQRMDIRLETINTFNHPNFSGLNTSFPSQTFGRVAGTATMRTMDLNLRFNF